MAAGALAVRSLIRYAQGNPRWKEDFDKGSRRHARHRSLHVLLCGELMFYGAIPMGLMLADDELWRHPRGVAGRRTIP